MRIKHFNLLYVFFAGVIAGFCVVQIAASGLQVLPNLAAPGILFSLVAIISVGLLSTLVYWFFAQNYLADRFRSRRRSASGKWLFLGLAAMAAALLLANLDKSNSTAWKMAKFAKPSVGVSKTSGAYKGQHFSHLHSDDHSQLNTAAITFFVPWPANMVGGEIDIVVRTDSSNGNEEQSHCYGTNEELGSRLKIDEESSFATVFFLDPCSKWKRAKVVFPSGIEIIALAFEHSGSDSQEIVDVDWAIVGTNENYSLFWSFAVATGFVIIFGALALFVVMTGSTVAEKVSTARGRWELDKSSWIMIFASVFVFILASNVFVSHFTSQERTVYTWDFAGHWMSAVAARKALMGVRPQSGSRPSLSDISGVDNRRPGDGLQTFPEKPGPLESLLRNIRYSEYNITAGLPVALPMLLLGESRLDYELSLVNVYALFAVVMLLGAVSAVGNRFRDCSLKSWPVIPVIIILFFVPFWVPLVRGYLGVCVVGLDLLAFWLYFKRPTSRLGLPTIVAIATLLAATVIMRRWNAYWVVGFFAIMIVDGLWLCSVRHNFQVKTLLEAFRIPMAVGVISFGILSAIAWPLVVTMVTTDYADIYSAYADNSGVFEETAHFVRTFGLFLIFVTAASAAYLVQTKSFRRIAVLLVFQICLMVLHFSSTQTMGPHHMYILMPAAFILISIAIIHAVSQSSRNIRITGFLVLALYAINGLASGIAVFAVSGDPVRQALVPMVPDNRRIPLIRHDIDELARLAHFLDTRLTEMPPTSSVYVLASSTVLNVAHLRMLETSTGIRFQSVDRLLRTAAVDKRDGFPRELLEAELVVVADPIQFNRRPEHQQVIELPAKMILSKIGIGRAFEKLPVSFELESGVQVQVFQRGRANTTEEIWELSDQLRKVYPDRPGIYR